MKKQSYQEFPKFQKYSFKSFAKVNLFLQVLKRRKDNYHNLKTLFARISLSDTITLTRRNDGLIKVSSDSKLVPGGENNLCYRAADVLRKKFDLNYGININIKKNIPVGAGLGGGSSDAAGIFIALNKLWNFNLNTRKLADLAQKAGSDVPFFIYNTKFASGRGRGEIIEPLPILNKKKLWLILVYPKISVSTPLIYRRFDTCLPAGRVFSGLTRPKYDVNILTSELSKEGLNIGPKHLFNSLEPVTCSLYPIVIQVKKALLDLGLDKVMMSGSGPAVFGICDSLNQARAYKKKLMGAYKAWQIFVTSTV